MLAAIAQLPETHPLAEAPESYRLGFVPAFLRAYGHRTDARKLLQEKFFIPQPTGYSYDKFLQSAAELSVANHIALSPVTEHDTERQMHSAGSEKDVDSYYRIGATQVALEVKCPVEEAISPDKPTLRFDGRHPDHLEVTAELSAIFGQAENLPPELRHLEVAQHMDNKLKSFLTSAHDKFAPSTDLDQLNVLLVACGEDLQPWHSYLKGPQGLFTPQSFWPVKDFVRTQVVILSNLKYFHTTCRAHHDWTLQNVFLLPVVNPAAENRVTSETLRGGLSIFDHHLGTFTAFDPRSADPDVPDYIDSALKLNTYVHAGLSEQKFARFFPCTPRRGQIKL